MATLLGSVQKVKEKEPLFSTLLSELIPVLEKEVPTLGTDGVHLFYNPDFLKPLTDEEGAAVVLHETLHCAFQHVWRKGKREQMKWNIATDFAINTIVEESFHLPKGCCLDNKFYGMSAEQIYERLPKGRKGQTWCDKDKWEGMAKKGKGKGTGEDDKKDSDKKEMSAKEKAKAEQTRCKWEKIYRDKIVQQYGKMSDSMKRMIEKQFYVPVVDWQNLVANILSEDVTDYTFNTPDRRYLGDDFVLPDLYSIDKVKDVVFAYDTSGSIGDDDLHAFYNETIEIFKQFSNLSGFIAICDAQLHTFREIEEKDKYSQWDFAGGGGTAFEPVFREIEKQGLRPKAVFYFTDTQGSFPPDPGYPVYWLVRSYVGDNFEYQVPFGEVIKFLGKT